MEEPLLSTGLRALYGGPAGSLAGRSLGHYQVSRMLDGGGMGGEVYLAEDCRLERPVALKFISNHYAGDEWAREQMMKEARAVARLEHPHICQVYGVEEIDGHHFIVMQYVEGETLASLMRRGRLRLGTRRRAGRADRGRARLRARARRHPPRREAAEHHGDAGRAGQGARLRPRQVRPVAARRRAGRRRRPGADAALRRRGRHAGLHVARAGARRRAGLSQRHLQFRRRPLRDARGAQPLSARHGRRDRRGRPRGDPAAAALPPARSASWPSNVSRRSARGAPSRPTLLARRLRRLRESRDGGGARRARLLPPPVSRHLGRYAAAATRSPCCSRPSPATPTEDECRGCTRWPSCPSPTRTATWKAPPERRSDARPLSTSSPTSRGSGSSSSCRAPRRPARVKPMSCCAPGAS